jgi:hypothetical protein
VCRNVVDKQRKMRHKSSVLQAVLGGQVLQEDVGCTGLAACQSCTCGLENLRRSQLAC